MRIVVPAIIIFGALGGLMAMAITRMGIPEVQLAQLLDDPSFVGSTVKLQGVIQEIQQETRPLRFVVRDKEDPARTLSVTVDDVRPDLFKVGNDVAVEGVYDPGQGLLLGSKLYTKCPSKYVAEEGAEGPAEAAAPAVSRE